MDRMQEKTIGTELKEAEKVAIGLAQQPENFVGSSDEALAQRLLQMSKKLFDLGALPLPLPARKQESSIHPRILIRSMYSNFPPPPQFPSPSSEGRMCEGKALQARGGPLSELALDGLDSEQVWEQLALHHGPLLRHLRRHAEPLLRAAAGSGEDSHDVDDYEAGSLFFPFVRPHAALWLCPHLAISPVV